MPLDDDFSDSRVDPRPVFITVLCILTFIGVFFGIVLNLYWWALTNTHITDEATSSYSVLINIAGNLLCLFGALGMWKQKRSGFVIYLIGQVIPLCVHFAFWNKYIDSSFGMMNFFVFYMMIPLIFVILYSVNLKFMK